MLYKAVIKSEPTWDFVNNSLYSWIKLVLITFFIYDQNDHFIYRNWMSGISMDSSISSEPVSKPITKPVNMNSITSIVYAKVIYLINLFNLYNKYV